MAVICPGVHAPSLTQSFVDSVNWQGIEVLMFPSDLYPGYCGLDIYHFLSRHQIDRTSQLILIGFSAGVVGAIAAAWLWQLSGGKVEALVAFDGWGVPLFGNFEIYRFSHDYFTHVTSAWLGTGVESFYADPPVAHLEFWRSPHLTNGYSISNLDIFSSLKQSITAANYLQYLLNKGRGKREEGGRESKYIV
ncbi:hypothetical protein C7B64_02170 [Merismopedia glauca CCAP 1448/3]|uniref:Alpha/beta hydrolase n=1 Tax=Merismopedia glauca CCAP 1448/3 TaxID=1296344 RepID=A0A2T1C9B5_9CYAN|nr:hypothetical protein C7B64_02170 [Merismopedia glauca CCAP 1448/3]